MCVNVSESVREGGGERREGRDRGSKGGRTNSALGLRGDWVP